MVKSSQFNEKTNSKKIIAGFEKLTYSFVIMIAMFLVFVAVFTAFVPASTAAAPKWTNPTDAIGQLWGARLTNGGPWPLEKTNNYNALDPRVKEVSTNTASGLVIPSISINHPNLTDGLKQMSWALLTYNLNTQQTGQFIPQGVGVPPAEPFPRLDANFWADLLRSPHANERNHLPNLNIPPNFDVRQCPNLKDMSRLDVLNTLDRTANITNQFRWHCYADRFKQVGGQIIPLTGYIEITQNEDYLNQYDYARSDGRIVFDYINGRVFYTPAHYKQWKTANFAPDETANYGCTPPNTCANPFFELVQ